MSGLESRETVAESSFLLPSCPRNLHRRASQWFTLLSRGIMCIYVKQNGSFSGFAVSGRIWRNCSGLIRGWTSRVGILDRGSSRLSAVPVFRRGRGASECIPRVRNRWLLADASRTWPTVTGDKAVSNGWKPRGRAEKARARTDCERKPASFFTNG